MGMDVGGVVDTGLTDNNGVSDACRRDVEAGLGGCTFPPRRPPLHQSLASEANKWLWLVGRH